MASDSIIKLSADSLLVTEDIVPISNKVRFITGLTDQYYMKRLDGNVANDGDVLLSNGTDWLYGSLSANESNVLSTVRPTQVTSTQNNYNPSGYSTTKSQTIEINGNGNFITITGLTSATRDGVEKTFDNVGTNSLIFAKLHTGSSSANRFDVTKDLILYPKMVATFRYDSIGQKWKLKSTNESQVSYGNVVSMDLRRNTGFATTNREEIFGPNGGSISAIPATSSNLNPIRSLSFSTGVVATSSPIYSVKSSAVFLSANETYIRVLAKIQTSATASTNAQSYEIKLALEADVDTIVEEGAYILYHHNTNAGDWTVTTHNGTTSSSVDSDVAFATSTDYDLELIYYPYGEVVAFINGTRVAKTSDLPTDIACQAFVQLDKDNGTTASSFTLTAFEFQAVYVSD